MSITPLPSAPQPTDSTATFNTKAFAWVAALDTFTTETNALAVAVDADAAAADADAIAAAAFAATAEAAADTAVAAAGAELWVSGTTYAIGDVVWSPSTYLSYRRKTNGAGTTDPTSDSTNWELISGNVTTTGVQTLSNKTFTGAKITLSALGTLTTGTTTIDLASAQAFTATITASNTITIAFSNAPSAGTSQVVLLRLTNAGAGAIVWPANSKFAGGTSPTLTTSGVDVLGVYYDVTTTTYMVFVIGLDVKVP